MKNSYKALLLSVLGLSAVSAAQAQQNNSITPNPVLLGLNDANTLNDYVLNIGTANQFTQSAVLGGSLDTTVGSTHNTISSVFGADASYGSHINIGLFAGDGNEPNVLQSHNGTALATAGAIDISYNAGLYTGTTLGVSAKSGGSSWDSIVEQSPTMTGSSLSGSVTASSTGLFMTTAAGGLYSEQVYYTDPNFTDVSGNNVVVDLGTLLVNLNNDTWSFNGINASAVPEPSTYGLLAGAGLLLVGVRRQFVKKSA